MASHKIKVETVQVKAADDALGIRTEVDAVGVDNKRRKVAIELKTTQHTKPSFSAAYFTPCRNMATLTNGLPNCLHWRHQLQAGFAVVATDCVRAVVAVMCSDGGLLYEVKPTAWNRAMFAGAVTAAEVALRAPLLEYPAGSDAQLLAALRKRLRYTTVVSHRPTVVRGPRGDAILLLVHKGANYKTTRAATAHRELARILARKHRVAAVAGWLDGGTWRFETVVRRPT